MTPGPALPTYRVEVRDRLDVHDAQSKTRELAAALGFASQRIAEALVVVSELATNILRHSRSGALELAALRGGGLLVITATDTGPIIENFDRALEDGSGPRGPILAAATDSPFGASTGLGAVHRLSDALEHAATPEGGNRIVARVKPHGRSISSR